ncbi:MAG: DUF3310 domain-containing protein [Acidimicrobiia bacterium]|nr:DUF3310 domain-containing protein [Acidimicrobiia bacterium]
MKKGIGLAKSSKADKTQIGGNHYKDMSIQVSDYVYSNNFNWYQGNIIKYISRYNKKNQNTNLQIQDIQKAIHYAQLLIDKLKENK